MDSHKVSFAVAMVEEYACASVRSAGICLHTEEGEAATARAAETVIANMFTGKSWSDFVQDASEGPFTKSERAAILAEVFAVYGVTL